MPTRAERFRAKTERSGPKKAPKPKRPRRDVDVDTSKPGVSATDRKAGGGSTAGRNKSRRAAKKAPVVLEDSAKRPSRKSTRRGKNRTKKGTNLQRRAVRATRSPKSRAAKAKAKAKAR